MQSRYDLAIIGSGGAAFAAAIRATTLGKSVVMIERGTFGGTCVNTGCVPSKALIAAGADLHLLDMRAYDALTVAGVIVVSRDTAILRSAGAAGAFALNEGDALAWTRLTSGHDMLIVATRNGQAIRFNEADARPMGRSGHGVRAIPEPSMETVKEDWTKVRSKGRAARRRADELRRPGRAAPAGGGQHLHHPARDGRP